MAATDTGRRIPEHQRAGYFPRGCHQMSNRADWYIFAHAPRIEYLPGPLAALN